MTQGLFEIRAVTIQPQTSAHVVDLRAEAEDLSLYDFALHCALSF